MTHRLAIVIPAYKATFLPAALDSIAAQTCKDFTLYVGDDCSPESIGDIVERYKDRINLVYQRFETNLGGNDLVAQWERCIAMSQDEPYIWLFSDDDVMEPNCVEALFKQIEKTDEAYDLYHFNVDYVDENGFFEKRKQDYPAILSAYNFYRGKNSGRYSAFAVENVFTRTIHKKLGGFMKSDLAWGSDVATWVMFCGSKGMCTIPNARVHWRKSSQNITPNTSCKISERKLLAEVALLNWAYHFFNTEPDIYAVHRAFFIYKIHCYRKFVSKKIIENAFDSFYAVHGHKNDSRIIRFFASLNDKIYYRIRKRFSWLYGDKR